MKFNVLVFIAASSVVLNATEPSSSQHSPNLAPIAFFTVHEWETQLPDTPDGKKKKIHAQFTWARNGQAILISNQFITDGKPSPYLDGLYAWDPRQRTIVFWYVGADGSLTTGTVKSEGAQLVHNFQQTELDGKTAEYVARVTPHGTDSWENEIFARSEKGLTSIVKVEYRAVP